MFDGGAGGSKSNIYLTNLNWRDIYAERKLDPRKISPRRAEDGAMLKMHQKGLKLNLNWLKIDE